MKNYALIFSFCFLAFSRLFAQNGVYEEVSKSGQMIQYVDLNNDNKKDIVLADYMAISYMLNIGNNEYSMKVDIYDSLNYNYQLDINNELNRVSVCIADFDHNGFQDLIFLATNPGRLIYVKNDNLQLTVTELPNLPQGAIFSRKIDLNNDLHEDVVVTYEIPDPNISGAYLDHGTYLFQNDGNGNFYNGNKITWVVADDYTIMDLNNDGFEDIVTYNFNENGVDGIGYLLNDNGTLENLISVPTYGNYNTFVVYDYNSDGVKDYLVPYNSQTNNFVWRDVNYQVSDYIVNVPEREEIKISKLCDFDQDGKQDVMTLGTSKLSWYSIETNGALTFNGDLLSGVDDATDFFIQDLNEDGFNDLTLASIDYRDGETSEFFNDGNQNLSSSQKVISTPYNVTKLNVIDLDGDGLKDLIYSDGYSTYALAWQKNLGANGYAIPQYIFRDFSNLWIYEVADLDNDGDMDLVMSGSFYLNSIIYSNKVIAYYNNGDGTFTNLAVLDDAQVSQLVIKDVNNDGLKDVVAISNGGSSSTLNFYKNNNGSFTETTINYYGYDKSSLTVEDYNMDGLTDIACVALLSPFYTGGLTVFENQGSSFSAPILRTVKPRQFYKTLSSDFDNDGDADLLIENSYYINNGETLTSYVQIKKNDGNGNFTDSLTIDTAQVLLSTNFYRIKDYDLDGDLDIFQIVENDYFLFQNNGDGSFQTKIQFNPSYRGISDLKIISVNGEEKIFLSSLKNSRILGYKTFQTGNQPVLSASASTVCSGAMVQITVNNALDLNNNTTWGLFSKNNGVYELQQTATDGIFNVTIFENTVFYINATEGIPLNGAMDSIEITLTASLSQPALSSTVISHDSLNFQWNSTSNAGTAWEYSTDNGTNWTQVDYTNLSIGLGDLNPNTCIDFYLREVGPNGACPTNIPAHELICSNCLTDTVYQTSYACYDSYFTFPDGAVDFYIDSAQMHLSFLENQFGCDSIVKTNLLAYPGNYVQLHDTICSGEDYTFLDGHTVYSPQEDFDHYIVYTGINGCDSTVTYNVHLAYPSPNTVNVSICSGDSYTFPDNVTSSNITSSFSYFIPYTNAGGCDSTVEYYIYVHPLVDVSLDFINPMCDTMPVFYFTNGSPAGGQYYFNGESAGGFMPNSDLVGMNTLVYTFIDGQTLCSGSDTLLVEVVYCWPNALKEIETHAIQVYPNPFTTEIHIQYDGLISKCQVLDLNGKIISENDSKDVECANLSNGIYLLKVFADNREEVFLIVKE